MEIVLDNVMLNWMELIVKKLQQQKVIISINQLKLSKIPHFIGRIQIKDKHHHLI